MPFELFCQSLKLLPQHKSRPTGCNAASQQELAGVKRGLGALRFVRTRSVHLAKLPGPGRPSRHGGSGCQCQCLQRRRRRPRVACTLAGPGHPSRHGGCHCSQTRRRRLRVACTSTKAHTPHRPLRPCQENPTGRSALHHHDTPKCTTPVCTTNNAPARLLGAASRATKLSGGPAGRGMEA